MPACSCREKALAIPLLVDNAAEVDEEEEEEEEEAGAEVAGALRRDQMLGAVMRNAGSPRGLAADGFGGDGECGLDESREACASRSESPSDANWSLSCSSDGEGVEEAV